VICDCDSNGIGYAVLACYAARGYGPSILHTKHSDWLSCISDPDLIVKPWRRTDCPIYDAYQDELLATRDGAMSRAEWYSSRISHHAGLNPKSPSRPSVSIVGKDFPVMIFPGSAWSGREWPLEHWVRLARLVARSVPVAVLTIDEQKARIFSCTPVSFYWGQSPQWILDRMAGCPLVIGNDSGMVHLAGLLGKPALAIHAQIRPEVLYKESGSVISVIPDSSCCGCHFQGI